MHNLSNYWINVKKIKNFILDDPLLDWLDIYGKENGFEYDSNLKDSFKDFISQKNNLFKKKIIENIKENNCIFEIDKKIDTRKKISLTLKYIIEGKEIIINPELFDNDNNLYGSCDLIIRSDKINNVFRDKIDYKECHQGCSLHKKFHYVIINFYCIKIKLSKNSGILNTKKNIIIKGTNIILNNALSNIQGYKPQNIFIIGDKYEMNNKIVDSNKFVSYIDKNDEEKINDKLNSSIKWLKELYLYGKDWSIFPPSRNELYPNMCNIENDFPWHNVKKEIALKLNEITLLWNCGVKQRDYFHKKGIYEWKDNNFDTNNLGFNNNKKKIISKMVDINHYYDNISIYPRKIKNKKNIEILKKNDLEFIVDFETINLEDENEHFKGIFMIGCFVISKENDIYETHFKQFTAEYLNDNEEERIVKDWIDYMENFEQKLNIQNCKIFHWGKAEQSIYKQVNNKLGFKKLNFIDLLDIFKTEPIIIKDCFSYGLKDIVKSLHKYGFIENIWEEEMNGKEAMIKAWENYNSKKKTNIMDNISKYNYYDCKVIDDILSFVRKMI